MPWVGRGRRRYYYRSVKAGGRAAKLYLGRGPEAEEAAAAVERRRADRAARAAALAADGRRHAAALGPLDELCELSDLLMRAALVGQGFHQHDRGVWRRRRHGTEGNQAGGAEGLSRGAEGAAGAG